MWQTGSGTTGQYLLPVVGDGQCAGVGPTIVGSNASFTVLRNTLTTYSYGGTLHNGASTCSRNQMNPVDPNTGTNYLLTLGTFYRFTFQTIVTLNGNYLHQGAVGGGLAADIPAIVWQTHSYGGDAGSCAGLVIHNTYAAWIAGVSQYGAVSQGGLPVWNFHSCAEGDYGAGAYWSPDTLHDGEVDDWRIDMTPQITGGPAGSIVVFRNGLQVYSSTGAACDASTALCFWNFGPYMFYWSTSEEPPGWNDAGVTVQMNSMTLAAPSPSPGPATPTPSASPIPTATPTASPSPTPTASPSPTPSPSPSASPSPSPSPTALFSLFGTAVPSLGSGDNQAVEVGTEFTSTVAGNVTAIRFYKEAADSGAHIGNLWSSSGTLLKSIAFSGETSSGWQQMALTTPYPALSANSVYVVSFHSTTGNYASTNAYFNTLSTVSGPLVAPYTACSALPHGNGVYSYGASTFPTNTYLGSNYYADVVVSVPAAGGYPTFAPCPSPSPSASPSPSPSPTASSGMPAYIYGITDDQSGASQSQIASTLATFGRRMGIRLVADGSGWAASSDAARIAAYEPYAGTMIELYDSADIKASGPTSGTVTTVTNNYLAQATQPDVYEIGNEINGTPGGTWLTGCPPDTTTWTSGTACVGLYNTMYTLVHNAGKQTALTFYYEPSPGAGYDMVGYAAHLAAAFPAMASGLNYVLISYYEDGNGNVRPSLATWQSLFTSLHGYFPNAKLGFGEVGLGNAITSGTLTQAQGIMNYYYGLQPVIPGATWVGGDFWWYGAQDIAPSASAIMYPTLKALAGGYADGYLPPIGWQFFSPNPFSVPACTSDPCSPTLDPNSANEVAQMMGGSFRLGQIGAAQPGTNGCNASMSICAASTPILYASASDPVYNVTCNILAVGPGCGGLFPNGVHIPNGAYASPDGDHHLVAVYLPTGTEYDFWEFNNGSSTPVSGGGTVTVGYGGTCTVSTYASQGTCLGSGNAANFSVMAGQLNPLEVVAQRIPQVLYVGVACQASGSAWPASGGGGTCANGVEVGQRIWLDLSDAQIEALSAHRWVKTFLHQLHDYGLMVSDFAAVGPWVTSPLSNETYTLWGQPAPWTSFFNEVTAEGDESLVNYSNNSSHLNIPTAGISQSNIHVLSGCVNTQSC